MAEQRTLTANFTANSSGFSPAVNELVQKLKSLNQEFEQNKAKIKEINTTMKSYQRELTELQNVERSGQTLTTEQKNRMQELRDRIAQCATELGAFRAAQRQLSSQINSTNRELTEQNQQAQNVSNAMLSMADVIKANLLSGAVMNGLRQLTSMMKTAASYCYSVGSSFEAAMSRVGAVSGAGNGDLETLTAKAKELGETTKFSATEAAQAMNYMAMAGWDTSQMLNGIDGVLSLAAAAGEDLGLTADIVTDAITAFGLKAEDVAHFSDVLAAASSNANTNVAMMGETFQYAAPIAGALGYSIEDVAEAIGLMANSGIKSSMAGTALRTTLTKLSDGATITGKAIGEVKIQAANADGSMRELTDVLDDMRGAFSQLSESEKTTAAESIVGKYAMSGFLALMGAGEADINKLRGAIENCSGAAADMSQIMQDNVAGGVTIMKSALEGVGIAVYEKFSDGLSDAVNIFTECLGELNESVSSGELDGAFSRLSDSIRLFAEYAADVVKDSLPSIINGVSGFIKIIVNCRKEIGSFINAFIAYKTSLGAVNFLVGMISSFKSLITAIKGATSAASLFNGALAANPAGLIALAFSGLIFAISEVAAHADDAAEKVEELNQASKEAAQAAREYKQEAEELSDIAREYDELSQSAEDTAEKREQLNALQQDFINSYGSEVQGIDLVNGAYENQANILQDVIDKKNELAADEIEKEYNLALNAAEAEQGLERVYHGIDNVFGIKSDSTEGAVEDERVKEALLKAKRNHNNIEFSDAYDNGFLHLEGVDTFKVTGSADAKIAAYNAMIQALKDAGLGPGYEGENAEDIRAFFNTLLADKKAVMEVRDSLENAERDYEELNYNADPSKSGADPYGNYQKAPRKTKKDYEQEKVDGILQDRFEDVEQYNTPGQAAELSLEEKKKAYNDEKQLADAMYRARALSVEEYYNKLKELRDTYLKEGTREWYNATADLVSLEDQLAKGVKGANDKLISQFESAADSAKSELSEIEKAYRDTLDAIDREIERHNRQKEDEDMNAKIGEVKARLEFEHIDDFERYELEKELERLEEEKAEIDWERSVNDKKDAAENNYAAAKSATDELTEAANNAAKTLSQMEVVDEEYMEARQNYTDALKNYSAAMEQAQSMLGSGSVVNQSVYNTSSVTNNNVSLVTQAASMTASQIVRLVKKALSSGL